ncbi:MAG: Ig-like domain-containing protein [Firmicutes bacterium]|nr:Ig-like domain-containing protein [Bacillota bacterium]
MRKKALIVSAMILALVLNTAFAFAVPSVSRYTGTTYSHNDVHADKVIVDGLDVSIYQKSIDWEKAKADGVDFAIIRVGGRGYGSEGKMYSDDNFKKNIDGANAAGILTGIYFFSQAVNEIEAVAEARYAVQLMQEAGVYELDLPIFMDYEFAGGSSGRLNKAKLTKSAATKVARAFCEEVKALGYKPGIYANLNFLNDTIDGKTLGQEYPIWVAQYYKQNNYNHEYTWWQYSSGGKVLGISARNDCNFWYLDKNPVATSMFSAAAAQAYINGTDTFTYAAGAAYQPAVKVTINGIPLTEGTDYTVKYVNNTSAGTAYAMVMGKGIYTDYCLVPFTIMPSTDLSAITVADISSVTYTGSEVKPSSITVKDGLGRTLVNGLDYTYTVSDAVNAGNAKVKIDFSGDYSGSKTVSYTIKKAAQTITIGDSRSEIPFNQPDYNLGVSLKYKEAKVTYSSSNKDVVTVSKDGTVSVKGQGTATITVKAASTNNINAAEKTIDITVKKPAQTVTSKYTKYSKDMSDTSFSLTGVASDGDGKITYASSDESVVKVSTKGKVTVVGPGAAVITVTASETANFSAGTKEIYVTVEKIQQEVTTGYTKYNRKDLDKKFSLNSKTTGDGQLTYTSSDEAVVTINEKGTVTVVGPGIAEITVTAAETDKFFAGQKVVTINVSGFENEEEREAYKQELIAGIQGTGIKSVKLTALSKKVRIDWKKQSSGFAVDYYQVYRSTKKSSGYKRIYTTPDAKTLSCINTKNVTQGTTYWYKIRGVREIDGEKVYTEFTKATIKTLK